MKRIRPLEIVLLIIIVVLVAYKIKTATTPLSTRLVSKEDDVRNEALTQIMKLDAAGKEKLAAKMNEALMSQDPDVRRYALYSIRKVKTQDPAVIKAVADSLSEKDEKVRSEAVVAMLELGPVTVPAAIAMLRTEDVVATDAAAEVLEKFGKESTVALAAVVKEKGNGSAEAIEVLKKIGPEAAEARPELEAVVADADSPLRMEASLALLAIGNPFDKAYTALAHALDGNLSESKNMEIVEALARERTNAKAAAPSISKLMMRSSDGYLEKTYLRPLCARALAEVDPRRTTYVDLGFDVKQKDPALRYRGAFTLSERPDLDAGGLDALVTAAKDKDDYTAARALNGIRRIGMDKLTRFGKTTIQSLQARSENLKKSVEGFKGI